MNTPSYNVLIRERDLCVLVKLARHLLLTRPQISKLCYVDSDRVARDRLSKMTRGGYVQRKRFRGQDSQGAATFLYMLTKKGCRYLADHFDEQRYALKPTKLRQPLFTDHYLAVTGISILLQEWAILAQEKVQLMAWFNEEEIVNYGELDDTKHHRLYTQLRTEPRKLVCDPDAAFMLESGGHRAVFYVERERDRNSPRRVAAMKTPGYRELLVQQGHRRHFPDTTLERFTVLFICERKNHRDRLRLAFRDKPDPKRWRFASTKDLTAESFLYSPVWYLCDEDEPRPLVRPTVS